MAESTSLVSLAAQVGHARAKVCAFAHGAQHVRVLRLKDDAFVNVRHCLAPEYHKGARIDLVCGRAEGAQGVFLRLVRQFQTGK